MDFCLRCLEPRTQEEQNKLDHGFPNSLLFSFQCALDTLYWTGFNHFFIWGSIVFYFAFTFLVYADFIGYEYMGTARNLMSTAVFWFTVLLTVTVLVVPVVAERFYYIDTRPTLNDKVRLKQKITKSQTKTQDLVLRRTSTIRRSQRSIGRSGYAFAHSEGFGELITTGANMRQTVPPTKHRPKIDSNTFNNNAATNATESALRE